MLVEIKHYLDFCMILYSASGVALQLGRLISRLKGRSVLYCSLVLLFVITSVMSDSDTIYFGVVAMSLRV